MRNQETYNGGAGVVLWVIVRIVAIIAVLVVAVFTMVVIPSALKTLV